MKTKVFSVHHVVKMTLFVALILMMVGCKDDKKDEPAQSIIGNVEKPQWKVTEDYDMTSSMTMVVKVDMTSVYNESQLSEVKFQVKDADIMAAYSGNSCLGVDSLIDGLNHLFVGNTSEGVESFRLKYYSSVLKHIFVSETIPFKGKDKKGTPSAPFVPKWSVEK